jgi:hypothetical protein
MSTGPWRPLQTSSTAELWDAILSDAGRESLLWGDASRVDAERDPVFSVLADKRFALGLETIYEGYLCHYGTPRLFAPYDDATRLLLGDYLYAHGLVRIAETGSIEAVQELAELISLCARLRAEREGGDAEAWLASAVALGPHPPDDLAVQRALAAHRARVS